jgi:hypothetical protein
MMGSFFQFLPFEGEVMQKMIRSASQKVILSEPISNISSSKIGILARLANWLTTPFEAAGHYTGERFDEQRLLSFLSSFPGFQKSTKVAGGRELIAVLKGEANA